jgi:predicted P-loop ATPase/GTPase
MDNIFVFGYQNEASGKTTISVSIARALANEGMKTGVFKPVSAHNFWYQYDHTLRNSDAKTLFCEDVYKLAKAAKTSAPPQLLNPVDRLISQPNIEKYAAPSPIDRILLERITSYENGIKDTYLMNESTRETLLHQREMLETICEGKETKKCQNFGEWDAVERNLLSNAISTCYSHLCNENEIVLAESYNNEIPFLLPDVKHTILTAPGRMFIYDVEDFRECFKVNASTKGRTTGEDVFRQIKAEYIIELSPLRRAQLEDYDFLAREIGKPLLETIGIL